MQVGVALKPTISYFCFFVTFRHNKICGLAVAFKNIFLGCLSVLLKIIPKTGDVGELLPNANNVKIPPPHSSSAMQLLAVYLFLRGKLGDAVAWGQH